ncbi:MAG: hypothetical protein U0T84_02395 [Chitinophagales bacterium]
MIRNFIITILTLVLFSACKTPKTVAVDSPKPTRKTTPYEDTLNARIQTADYVVLNNLKGGESPELLALISLYDKHFSLGINSVKWKLFENRQAIMSAYGNYYNGLSKPAISDSALRDPATALSVIDGFKKADVRFGWMTFCQYVNTPNRVIEFAVAEAMRDTQMLPEVCFILSEIKQKRCSCDSVLLNQSIAQVKQHLRTLLFDASGAVVERNDLAWNLRSLAFFNYIPDQSVDYKKVVDYLLAQQHNGGWATYPKPATAEALSQYNFDMYSTGFGLWALAEMRERYYLENHLEPLK